MSMFTFIFICMLVFIFMFIFMCIFYLYSYSKLSNYQPNDATATLELWDHDEAPTARQCLEDYVVRLCRDCKKSPLQFETEGLPQGLGPKGSSFSDFLHAGSCCGTIHFIPLARVAQDGRPKDKRLRLSFEESAQSYGFLVCKFLLPSRGCILNLTERQEFWPKFGTRTTSSIGLCLESRLHIILRCFQALRAT